VLCAHTLPKRRCHLEALMILLTLYRDYVFFFSYIQVEPKPGEALWSNAEEMCRVNSMRRG
jgi:hypothetical protein